MELVTFALVAPAGIMAVGYAAVSLFKYMKATAPKPQAVRNH